MPPSPKPESSSSFFLAGDDKVSSQSTLSPLLRSPLPIFRRTRRLHLLVSFPLTIILLYLLFPSWLDNSQLFAPPAPYISHSGKSALKSTITLPPIQFDFPPREGADYERREAVREVIERTWGLYAEDAWGWDEVRPVMGGGKDTRNGWGATIVDGLSTLLIAGMHKEVFDALNYTISIDFSHPDGLVDPFETIIRYMGGLVSAIDLLEYGFGGPSFDPRGLTAIRHRAEDLAHKLSPGLNSPMRMWLPRVDFRTGRGVEEDLWGDTSVSPARAGSNILEYGRLSELSADLVYFRNATAAWWPIVNPKRESIIPGMIAQPVSVETGNSLGDDIQWGAGQDSFYEYLIKAFILWPNSKTELYRDRWVLAVNSTMQNLSSWSLETLHQPSFRYLAMHDRRKKNEMGHLTCFAPGNFLLGARALERDDIFQFGLDILEGCWHAYNVTPTGISPELWKWRSNDTTDEPYTQLARKHWEEYGFWSTNRDYHLRPETIESYFYAYRLTGNKMYQDWAWNAFQHITAATRAPHGYSSIRDTLTPGGWYQSDAQESFWLAETLKYLYLIFDDPGRLSLDEWVFNTEAHPIRRGRKVKW